MNKPYVKVFDKNGVLTNPIKGMIVPDGPNRRQRRASLHYKEPQGLIVYNGGGGKDLATIQRIAVYKTIKVQNPDDKRKKIKVKKLVEIRKIKHTMPADLYSRQMVAKEKAKAEKEKLEKA